MSNFKVGDWVKYKDNDDDSLYQVVALLPNDLIDINCTITDKYNIELWQPKAGEWCWFSKWDKIICVDFYLCKFFWDMNEVEPEFKHKYEPFIGQLPTFLKETKCC